MKTKLKLFFEWGIELNESYRMPEARVRKVAYVNRQSVEERIKEKYESLMPRKKSVPLTEEQKKQIEAEKQAAETEKETQPAEAVTDTETEKPDMMEIIGKVKQTKT